MNLHLNKRIVAFILALALCISQCACSAKSENEPVTAGENQVVDGAGIVRDIPEDPQSATIASVYAVAVPMIVALNLTDRVLAINVKSNFWKENNEDLAAAGTIGRGVVDLEALAQYHPSVLIHRSNDPETVAAVEKLGIEVLCVTIENLEDIEYTLRMMGKYFGAEERAEEVIVWIGDKIAMIDKIVDKIPEEERYTALMLGGEPGRVAGDDMLQSWMIEKAGGICVADQGKDHNWMDVGVETVFNWNPEYIFCTGSTALDYTIEKLLADPAWSAVEAIKNEHISRVPAKIDGWDMPGISCVLGIMYMMHEMYPKYFSEEQLEKEIDEYYTFMFGRTFDAEYLGYNLENAE